LVIEPGGIATGDAGADYKITRLLNQTGIHGQYIDTEQRRSQKSETGGAQEAQHGTSIEASRVRSRVEEEQS
jgi:hypothetical protein